MIRCRRDMTDLGFDGQRAPPRFDVKLGVSARCREYAPQADSSTGSGDELKVAQAMPVATIEEIGARACQ